MHYILNDGRDDFDRTFMNTGLESTLCHHQSELESTTPGHKVYAAMTSPRCIVGHCPEQYLPPQVFDKKAKVRHEHHKRPFQTALKKTCALEI